jgi:hypothetical protein
MVYVLVTGNGPISLISFLLLRNFVILMSRRQQNNAIFLRDGICKCYDCEQLDDSCLRQRYNVDIELDGKRCKCKKAFLATCCYNGSKVCSDCIIFTYTYTMVVSV